MIRKICVSSLQYNYPIFIGVIGGFLVGFIGIPMGWMLGSLFFVAAIQFQKDNGDEFSLHPIWKQIAQVILAIQIGKQLDASILNSLTSNWVILLSLTGLTLLSTFVIGVVFSKMTNTSKMTGILAACPGGVSAIPVLSQQLKADTIVVSTTHVLRVIIVSCTIPMLTSFFSSSQVHLSGGLIKLRTEPLNETNLFQTCEFLHTQPLLWTAILCMAAALGFLLFHLLKFPSAVLIGSLIGAGTIQYMASSYSGLTLTACTPQWLSFCMQVFIGASLGISFKKSMLNNWKQTVWASGFIILSLITLSIGLSWMVHQLLSISFDTAVLAFAPGGIAVMTATAMVLKANASFVIAVQTLRLILILIIFSFLNRWIKPT